MSRKLTKSKSEEFQLKITPGAFLKCPRCGGENGLSLYDGDTIPLHEAMPDARDVADGLALAQDGHCFYACLNACVCRACGAGCYIVDLQVVKADEVSQDWADTHFWLNGPGVKPHFHFTATCRGAGLPQRWTGEWTKTDAGDLEHYRFGPFIPPTPLEGSNGVANCAGGTVWTEAAALIARVWPLIVKDVQWTESFTAKGRWPLHDVPGWTPHSGNKKDAPDAS
jgi:hypothetical protein